jgi:spore coat protein JB
MEKAFRFQTKAPKLINQGGTHLEERYIQPIGAGQPRGIAGLARPKTPANAMGNAAAVGVESSRAPNLKDTDAMPYMKNNMGTDTKPGNMHAKPNIGTMSGTMRYPNANGMPLTARTITGIMPEINPASINIGMMPEKKPAKPNMGVMHDTMPVKPNISVMPEMRPLKPNTGMMPELNQPDTGTMTNLANANSAFMNTAALPEILQKKIEAAEADTKGCGFKNGSLPSCAPLSVGFVPFQERNPPKYSNDEALTRGTLFPGLDLPWKDIVNKSNPYDGTPLGELMALRFAITELNLYLDTHMDDKEALDMLKTLNKLLREGTEKFARLYSPQMILDVTLGDRFSWIDNPWPWEYAEKGITENV